MKWYAVTLYLLAIAVLASCSGGGSNVLDGNGAKQRVVSGSLTFKIERPVATAGRAHPEFVSGAAVSAKIQVTGIATDVVVDISSCNANAGSTTDSQTCIVNITAPVQAGVVFTVTLYTGVNALGKVLGIGSTPPQTITGPGSFAVSVTVNGIVANIVASAVTAPGTALSLGQIGTTRLNIVASDAGGQPIFGTYGSPIAISVDDATNSFTASPSILTASGQLVTVSYSGSKTVTSATIKLTSDFATTTQVTVCSVFCVAQGSNLVLGFSQVTALNQLVGTGEDAITWAIDSLPVGATGDFAVLATKSGAPDTLTIRTTAGTPVGPSSFNRTLSDRPLVGEPAILVTKFPFEVTPAAQVVVPGADGCIGLCIAPGNTIDVPWTSTITGPYGWSVVGSLPPGWTSSFLPSPTGTTEHISTAANSPPGGYVIGAIQSQFPGAVPQFALLNLVQPGSQPAFQLTHAEATLAIRH